MEKNIKAIFLDVDHTFYDHAAGSVPALHWKAVDELKKNGYKVCICTGRPYLQLADLHIVEAFDWDGIVCANGADVYDKDMHSLYRVHMNEQSVKKIFEIARHQKLGLLPCGTTFFATQYDQTMQELYDTYSFHDVEIRTELQEGDYFDIICVATPKETRTQRRPEFENLEGIKVLYNLTSLDLIRDDTNKYTGIQILMKNFGFEADAYMAFGDSLNDIDMLKHARSSVRMENGDPRLDQYTDDVAPACSQGGIYHYLKEHGWIEHENRHHTD